MSAFVVEDRTINRVVCWLNHSDHKHDRTLVLDAAELCEREEDWTARLGISMFQMNVAAVNARYSENQEEFGYSFHWEMGNDIQVLKSLQCWLYQCAEGSVPDRPLFQAMHALKGRLACHIVSRLPEYDKAEWA